MSAQQIIAVIKSVQLGYATEAELQTQLLDLLKGEQLDVVPEFRLSARDRVDFLVNLPQCKIALECKIKGAPTTVVAQLARYAESPEVNEIVLVTSVRKHLAAEAFREREILGKPLHGVWIGGMR